MKFKQIIPVLALAIFMAGNLVSATPAQATEKVTAAIKKYGKQGKKYLCRKGSGFTSPSICRSAGGAICSPISALGEWKAVVGEVCATMCKGFDGFNESSCMKKTGYANPDAAIAGLQAKVSGKIPPKVSPLITTACSLKGSIGSTDLNNVCAAVAG